MPRMILDTWHGERGIDYAPWVSKHGLWGVICKCGGSDDSRWNRYEETTFVEQVTQARALGLHVGAFYYSDALNAADALADAQHCVGACIRGMRLDMPIYLDIEEKSQLSLPKARLTEVVRTWCDYVSGAGYQAGVYSGYEGFSKIDASAIAGHSRWLACWQESWPTWALDYDLWQEGSMSLDGRRYHREGEVDGAGRIDLDWASDEFAQRIEGGGEVDDRWFDPSEDWAELHAFLCTDPRWGYSQDPRWGEDGSNVLVPYTCKSGRTYMLDPGSFDCSSSELYVIGLVLERTKYARSIDAATYTGDMRRALCDTGLWAADMRPARRGDLYLAENKHTAMCQDGGSDGVYGYDCLSEFNRNEHHTATGGQPGDQDGYESVIRGYYDDGWNWVLHYVGGKLEDLKWDGDEDDKEVTPMDARFVILDDANFFWEKNRLSEWWVQTSFKQDGFQESMIEPALSMLANPPWWLKLFNIGKKKHT